MTSTAARARIARMAHLNAFISLSAEEGEGPVVAVKDLIDVVGLPTTGGGAIGPRLPAAADAEVVARIRHRGGIVIGKTNLHEWAFGVSSANPHYGTVRNPRDPSRLAGGSSGGSAAAVAAGMCDWAIGTETGGSIRIPAGLCGVVGLRPTRGRVGTGGVFPLSRSLDVVGPLAPDVATAAAALEWMSGLEGLVPAAPPPLSSLRIGVPAGWVEIDELDPLTAAVWRQVGAGLPEIDFPGRERVVAPMVTIMFAEAGAQHRRWLAEFPRAYGADVRERLLRGLAIPLADYMAARVELERMREEVCAALRGWDAIMLPVTACVAPSLEETGVYEPLVRFCRPFSGTGHPAIAIPAPSGGLPVGIQLIGNWDDEAGLIRAASALELHWRTRDDAD